MIFSGRLQFSGYSGRLLRLLRSSSPVKEEISNPLPKFGYWDPDDPASAEGFTVIFNKARDEKRKVGGEPETSTNADPVPAPSNNVNDPAPPKGYFTKFLNKATDKMKKAVSRSSQ